MNLRRLNSRLHRDLGYLLSGLILAYCLSGIALNHARDWDADFIIQKRAITLDRSYTREEITSERIAQFTALVGETPPKVQDFPTASQVKLYFDNASLLVDFAAQTGLYERITRRPLFYQANALHRNRLAGWKWMADLFGAALALLVISGWFIRDGGQGLRGRGKWLLAAGFIPPVAAVILFQWLQ